LVLARSLSNILRDVSMKQIDTAEEISSWNHLSSMGPCIQLLDTALVPVVKQNMELYRTRVFTVQLKRVRSEKDLFKELKHTEGLLPRHFGYNWDALVDVFDDFSWLNETQIAVIWVGASLLLHVDRPLHRKLLHCCCRVSSGFEIKYTTKEIVHIFA